MIQLLKSRYMGPLGPRQRLAAAPRGAPATFPPGISISYPRTSLRSHSGSVPKISFSPARLKGKRKGPTANERKDKRNRTNKHSHPPSFYSSMPSTAGLVTPSTSSSPSSSAAGATAPGAPSLLSLRGGGGDLRPLAACWAILLAAQASALAP